MEVSKVLIIGATGYVGQHIAKASLALGHPTYLLVRPPQLPTTNSNPDQRLELIRSFQASGAVVLEGSLEDPTSLVEAMKHVDVVISAVGHHGYSHSGTQLADQARIIEAIQEVGTIKRFVPSEFGVDVDRLDLHPLMKATLIDKVHIRRAIEKAGIPYTIVSANNLFIPFLDRNLSKTIHSDPNLRTTFKIFGDGNTKAIYVSEVDVGTYTIKAIDDPCTLNKIVYIRPCTNILTQKELLLLWEQKIGRSIDVSYVTQEELEVQFEGSSHEEKLILAFCESIFIRGVEVFDIDTHGIEVTQLYGDEVTYINVENYLNELKNNLIENPN